MREKDENTAPGSCDLVFAADLGGTNLRAATVNLQGTTRLRLKHPTPHTDHAQDIVNALVAAARECESSTKTNGGRICAVSVVVPGTVAADRETIIQAPNLSSLDGFRLAEVLRNELGYPVLLENDANAAAVGERWMGAARGCNTIICITLGTGVGGGIILDGELWRGPDGSAGEIGHTTIEPFSGIKCKCGNTGCLEVFASATAIVRMTRELFASFPDTILDAERLTAESIYEAGKQGDKLSLLVLTKMGQHLGIAIANLVNLLNPEMIVIGGGVANGWQLFEKTMNQEVSHRAFPLLQRRLKIVRAQCGDDAGLLGAAHLAFSTLPLNLNEGI